jgi:DNA-binding LytR/AlgR family response regulator
MREMQLDTVRAARGAGVQPVTKQSYRRGLIVATLAAFLMTFVGAFDTGQLPLLYRLAFWLILMESGALIGMGASTGIRSWGSLAARPFLEGALISLLIALPLTLVASGTTALFFGPRSVGLDRMVGLFLAVLIVTAAITAINYASGRIAQQPALLVLEDSPAPVPAAAQSDAPEPEAPARLAERLPRHLRTAAILALEAEDHYVRVHTDAGSDLLLLRLSDAMTELGAVAGSRTHRSWWVAHDGVASARKSEGRGELTLTNGLVVPVSRSALSSLQRESWFAALVSA